MTNYFPIIVEWSDTKLRETIQEVADLGHGRSFTVIETHIGQPKNSEIWKSKSGNIVMIVNNPHERRMGFVWFDPINHDLCYCDLHNQLSHKLNMTVAEWGLMMNELVPRSPTIPNFVDKLVDGSPNQIED